MNPIWYGAICGTNGAQYTWVELVPSVGFQPSGNRVAPAFTHDGTNFQLEGGFAFTPVTSYQDLWRFNLGTNSWTQTSAATGFPSVLGHVIPGTGTYSIDLSFQGFIMDRTGGGGEYQVNTTTAAHTDITGGLTPVPFNVLPAFDAANNTVYSMRQTEPAGGTNVDMYKAVISGLTVTVTTLTSAPIAGRVTGSSMAYCPTNNTLYMLAPVRVFLNSWFLAATDIIKYDLTAATGWVVETGVTMPPAGVQVATGTSPCQMIWHAPDSLFYIFFYKVGTEEIGSIATYDPITKLFAEVYYTGDPGTSILGQANFEPVTRCRGGMGTVVSIASGIYFCRTRADNSGGPFNARIWKFNKNY